MSKDLIMNNKIIIFSILFSIAFISCSKDETQKVINQPLVISTPSINLAGDYTLVVSKYQGSNYISTKTYNSDIIYQIDNITYKTVTTGYYNSIDYPTYSDYGHIFIVDTITNTIKIESQSLGGIFTNIVRGLAQNNSIDGHILSATTFETEYELPHTHQIPLYSYKASYTKN
jgi:hypothetical protein